MMKIRCSSVLFGAALLLPCATALWAAPSAAQDNHRWTNQFGTRASLLGGAVIGGTSDSSATFYNPGALGFLNDTSISVSANALRYERIERKNAIVDDVDFDSDDTNVVPLMVSGIWIPEEEPDLVIGYSLLTKNSSSFNATERLEGVVDSVNLPAFPGLEDTIVQTSQSNNLNEYWGGVGLGYRLSDSIGIGFTNFLALRNQDSSQVNQVRAVNQDFFSLSTLDSTESYDIWNLRALWKVGVQGNWNGIRSGLTVTTPSVDLAGDGTSFRDLTLSNYDLGGGEPVSFVASDRQDDLDAEYRTPMSVGWGLEVDITGSTRLAGSIEWFGGVGSYNVMDPEARPFLRPQGAFAGIESTDFLQVKDGSDDVTNFAIGIEQGLSEKWTGYLAFRSDYETYQPIPTEGQNLGFSTYDIYHVTVGATYEMPRSTLALGLEYSFGDSDDPAVNTREVENEYEAVSVILGYTYHFGDVVRKKS